MKQFFLLLTLVTIVSAVSAQKVISDPNVEKRNVSGYHAISVSAGIDLYLSQGSESVAVSASEVKYRDRIRTEVVNGVLKIGYESNSHINIDWRNDRKMKAYVSYKNLDHLTASGGSDIDVDGAITVPMLKLRLSGGSDFGGKVEVNDLTVEVSGGSDLDISGSVKNMEIDASGGSDFKGYGLASEFCKLEASGGSDVYVTVRKELTVDASGSSDVYYKGEAKVMNVRSNGSSSIKKESR